MDNNANGRAVANSGMSPEAQLYRRLLRNHIKIKLGPRAAQLASLSDEPINKQTSGAANNQRTQASNQNENSDEQLLALFDHWVTTFESQYRTEIEGFVTRLDVTAASIELHVRGVIDYLFEDQQYNWGRVVALSAFITCIALESDRKELSFIIGPLIDVTARSIDQHILQFIRTNGGWRGFFEYFHHYEERVNSRSTFTRIAACALGVLGVGVLAAFWAHK